MTPAERRRRRRSGLLVFVLFLAAVLAALAATVLSVNDGRNYRRLIRQVGLADYLLPKPPDMPVRTLSVPAPVIYYPRWLLNAFVEQGARFDSAPQLDAQERCENLRNDHTRELAFTGASGDWECIHLEQYGEAAEPGSFFLQARGSRPEVIGSFRIKLSLTDPATADIVIAAAIAAMERFGLPMSRDTRDYLKRMLTQRAGFSSSLENYRMKFSREMGDPRRYNLLILPRQPSLACEEPEAGGGSRLLVASITCLPLAQRGSNDDRSNGGGRLFQRY